MSDRMVIALPETIRDGVECQVLDDGDGMLAAVHVDGVGTVCLPHAWLKPVLPTEPSLGTAFRFADTLIEHRDNSGIGWYDWEGGTWLTWRDAVERGTANGQRLIPEPDVEWLAAELRQRCALTPDTCDRVAAELLHVMWGRT